MRTLIIVLCLLATPALADLAGPASVIDGDTIEVHGQRCRAAAWRRFGDVKFPLGQSRAAPADPRIALYGKPPPRSPSTA